MKGSKENSFDMNEAVNAWMKITGDVWGPMVGEMVKQTADLWSGGSGMDFGSGGGGTTKSQAAVNAALNNWQAMATALSSSESAEALLKGGGAMPEMLLKLGQNSFLGYLQLQQKITERIGRLGESTEAYKFEDIDENINHGLDDAACYLLAKEIKEVIKDPFGLVDYGMTVDIDDGDVVFTYPVDMCTAYFEEPDTGKFFSSLENPDIVGKRVRSWFRTTEEQLKEITNFLENCGGFTMP